MKKLLFFLLTLIFVFSMFAFGSNKNASTNSDGLMAGFARVACVPDDPLGLYAP